MTTRQSRPPPSAELIFNHTFAVQGREGGRERCIKKRSVLMSNAVMHGRWIKSRRLDGRLETWMNRQWRVFAQSSGEEGWLISQALQNRRPLIHPTKCLCVTDSGCVDVWGQVFVFLCVCVVAHLSPFVSSSHRQEKKNHAAVGDVSRTSFSRFEAFIHLHRHLKHPILVSELYFVFTVSHRFDARHSHTRRSITEEAVSSPKVGSTDCNAVHPQDMLSFQ